MIVSTIEWSFFVLIYFNLHSYCNEFKMWRLLFSLSTNSSSLRSAPCFTLFDTERKGMSRWVYSKNRSVVLIRCSQNIWEQLVIVFIFFSRSTIESSPHCSLLPTHWSNPWCIVSNHTLNEKYQVRNVYFLLLTEQERDLRLTGIAVRFVVHPSVVNINNHHQVKWRENESFDLGFVPLRRRKIYHIGLPCRFLLDESIETIRLMT